MKWPPFIPLFKSRQVACLRYMVFFIVISLCCVSSTYAQEDLEHREYQIKSSFLYRFIQFAELPATAQTEEITLCVLSESRFSIISRVLEQKKIGEKPLVTQQVDNINETEGCQVLFIDSSGEDVVLNDGYNNGSMLTVGESDNFTRQGGLIRFFEVKNKIRFEINTDAADKAGIIFSSKLLKLAKRV